MDKSSKIFIAGHNGLIGSSLVRKLTSLGYGNLILANKSELDLVNQEATYSFLDKNRPDYVFLAAGKVGGIYANAHYGADFLLENTQIASNVIYASFKYNVKKMIYFSCSSIYPIPYQKPYKEEDILTGPLERTCEPFAISKILGMKLCEYYNLQYGTDFIPVIPTNIYGINQKYNVMNSPAIPSLILRMYRAKTRGEKAIQIWGTGNAVRDFLYVDDLADAALYLINHYLGTSPINIGTGKEYSIEDIAKRLKKITGFTGEVIFTDEMPEGVKKKTQNLSKIQELKWFSKIDLSEGLELTYKDFLRNHRDTH